MVTELSSSSRFIWKIDNFSMLNSEDGLYSDVFIVGGYKWKAQVFPKGYRAVHDHLSVFLDPAETVRYPYEAEFSVAITSQTDRKYTLRFVNKHTFTEDFLMGWGWGERSALRLSELHDPDKGYIVNDSCVIKFEVSCRMNKDTVDNDIKESSPYLVPLSSRNLSLR